MIHRWSTPVTDWEQLNGPRVPVVVGTMLNEAGLSVSLIPGFDKPVTSSERIHIRIFKSGLIASNIAVQAIISTGLAKPSKP